MELQKINQRIAVVNAESKRLNNERQVLIGKRQTLEKQLADLLAAYKKEYGVELTAETIEAEIARVSALKEKEVANIEAMLGLIKEGRYAEAEKLATAQSGIETTEAPAVEEQPGPFQAESDSVSEQLVGVVSESAAEQPAQTVNPPTFTKTPETDVVVPEPAAPPTFTKPPEPAPAPAETTMPPTFAPPPEDDIPAPPPVFSAPPKPKVAPRPQPQPAVSDDAPPAPPPSFKPKQPLGTPKIGVPPTVGASQPGGMSFQAILSGEAFNPQKGG